jgi:hypothetical protein
MKYLAALVAGTLTLGTPAMVRAQTVIFTDNFDTTGGTAPAYNVNVSNATPGYAAATFGFDYSTVGIPSAPNSVGGTTLGLKLEANKLTASPAIGGVSVSPTTFGGNPFTGVPAGATNYTLRFDLWQNANGPFPGGGTGSTQNSGGGIGTTGTTHQFPGTAAAPGNVDGYTVLATAEGGASGTSTTVRDYTAWVSPGAFLNNTGYNASTVNPTQPQDNANSYYTGRFGNVSAPPNQQTLVGGPPPDQSGTVAAGSPGFEWHTWFIQRAGNTVTWTIRDYRDPLNPVDTLIHTADITSEPFAGNNFFLGQFDFFSSVAPSTDQPVLFGLFDNVVLTVNAVPEPGTFALAGLAIPALLRLRLRRRRKA